jgi:hypothetical protein
MHLSAQLYKSELSKSLRQKRSKKMKKNKDKRVVTSKKTK